MSDIVKMSSATLGIMMAQNKILAEEVNRDIQPGENRAEWRNRLMNRKLLYMGQEIVIDDRLPDRQILAAEAPKIGPDRFKPIRPRATVDNTKINTVNESDLKREILF